MHNIKKHVDFVIRGGQVNRYHNRPLIHTQNNAEHQFGVASIAALLDPGISKEALLYCLWHDVHEMYTGDIPYGSKLRWPGLKQVLNKAEAEIEKEHPILPVHERTSRYTMQLLKLAEFFEVLMYILRETYLGNTEFDQDNGVLIETVSILETRLLELSKYLTSHQGSDFTVTNNGYNLLRDTMEEYEKKTGKKWYSQGVTFKSIPTENTPEQEKEITETFQAYPQMGDL